MVQDFDNNSQGIVFVIFSCQRVESLQTILNLRLGGLAHQARSTSLIWRMAQERHKGGQATQLESALNTSVCGFWRGVSSLAAGECPRFAVLCEPCPLHLVAHCSATCDAVTLPCSSLLSERQLDLRHFPCRRGRLRIQECTATLLRHPKIRKRRWVQKSVGHKVP